MMETYAIVDTETTGLSAQATACEIAWITVDADLAILDAQTFLTDPEQPIEAGAQAIHGISLEEVKGLPNNKAICALMPKQLVWLGHNVSYDQRIIGEHVEFVGDLCTLALSRRWVKGTTNHKLSTLKAELGFSDQASHRALGDCHTTLELLRHISSISGRNLPQLVELEKPPKMLMTMPFGRYRGYRFDQIPKGYRDWLIARELPKDIRYSLEKTQIL